MFELLKFNVGPKSSSRLNGAYRHPSSCVGSCLAMPGYARVLRECLLGASCCTKTQLWLMPFHRL